MLVLGIHDVTNVGAGGFAVQGFDGRADKTIKQEQTMINSVSQSSGVSNSHQHEAQRTPPPAKTKEHEKQDSVHLSQQAQQAADADHDGDSH